MSIISELQKRYGEKRAVEDVSFEVVEGEIFGILGPNGAGKTTTVECIAGLRARDGGRISLRFHPSASFDRELLLALPEVESVHEHGDQVIVSGSGELPSAVIGTLARAGVIAERLRIQQSSLEDAFVALTDHGGSLERLAPAAR